MKHSKISQTTWLEELYDRFLRPIRDKDLVYCIISIDSTWCVTRDSSTIRPRPNIGVSVDKKSEYLLGWVPITLRCPLCRRLLVASAIRIEPKNTVLTNTTKPPTCRRKRHPPCRIECKNKVLTNTTSTCYCGTSRLLRRLEIDESHLSTSWNI